MERIAARRQRDTHDPKSRFFFITFPIGCVILLANTRRSLRVRIKPGAAVSASSVFPYHVATCFPQFSDRLVRGSYSSWECVKLAFYNHRAPAYLRFQSFTRFIRITIPKQLFWESSKLPESKSPQVRSGLLPKQFRTQRRTPTTLLLMKNQPIPDIAAANRVVILPNSNSAR